MSYSQIDEALHADRFRLRRQLRAIEQAQQAGKPWDRNLQRFQDELARSRALHSRG